MIGLLFIASALAESIVQMVNSDPESTWVAIEYPRSVITRAKMMARLGLRRNPHPLANNVAVKTFDESFDARTKWGDKILPVRDQGSCGSCWAFSIAEHFGDRLEIAGKGVGNLSPQDLVSCDTTDEGCNGGMFDTALNWTVQHGIATEACLPYASSSGTAPSCATKCNDGSAITRIKASSWKQLTVDEAMEEIQTNGPIAGGFTVYLDFEFYKSGVYKHVLPIVMGGHAIIVCGWGVEDKKNYWLCQNSWGASWGENGFFKILRGTNECGLEDELYTLYV